MSVWFLFSHIVRLLRFREKGSELWWEICRLPHNFMSVACFQVPIKLWCKSLFYTSAHLIIERSLLKSPCYSFNYRIWLYCTLHDFFSNLVIVVKARKLMVNTLFPASPKTMTVGNYSGSVKKTLTIFYYTFIFLTICGRS